MFAGCVFGGLVVAGDLHDHNSGSLIACSRACAQGPHRLDLARRHALQAQEVETLEGNPLLSEASLAGKATAPQGHSHPLAICHYHTTSPYMTASLWAL